MKKTFIAPRITVNKIAGAENFLVGSGTVNGPTLNGDKNANPGIPVGAKANFELSSDF